MVAPALFAATRTDVCTPLIIVERLVKMGGVGLDPCSSPRSIVGARKTYDIRRGEDGLVLPWSGHGLVYVNFPYGRGAAAWLGRAAGGEGDEVILLGPARTDTDAFQKYAFPADMLCFWKGRLTFLDEPAPAPFPSVLIYWGDRLALFKKVFSPYGVIMRKE